MSEKPILGDQSSQLGLLCQELHGSVCAAWRKGYGYTGTFHFGDMHALDNRHPGNVDADQGDTMLNLWGCDRILTNALGDVVVDSRLRREEEALDTFHSLEGARVAGVTFGVTELSLEFAFSDGHRLLLLVDAAQTGQDDEQWAVETNSGSSMAVFGRKLIRS